MNADEVCAMIDTITDGREYTYTLDKNAEVISDTTGVLFWAAFNHVFELTDPRQAREIAGLLVAWATTKEKKEESS